MTLLIDAHVSQRLAHGQRRAGDPDYPGLMGVRPDELKTVRGPRGRRAVIDRGFVALRTLAAYVSRMKAHGGYVED